MAASYQTIDEVIEVIKRHVDDEVFFRIVTDLQKVKGNASFETTINRMYDALKKQRTKKGPRH